MESLLLRVNGGLGIAASYDVLPFWISDNSIPDGLAMLSILITVPPGSPGRIYTKSGKGLIILYALTGYKARDSSAAHDVAFGSHSYHAFTRTAICSLPADTNGFLSVPDLLQPNDSTRPAPRPWLQAQRTPYCRMWAQVPLGVCWKMGGFQGGRRLPKLPGCHPCAEK